MSNEPLASSSSLIGAVLLGRYRIVRELAKGGMGVVYLARSEGAVGFVKPVVVKLVLPEHATDPRFLGMFAREAQILAHLRHPSIVTVLEFGEQDGAYVMVLEYVRGYHLGQWARFLKMKGRRIAADVALQITIDVLDALQHAHSMTHPDGSSMQIVHRDVSPSNILLDEDGRARLLDFGVARMRGGEVDYQTQVKSFVGKLMYSPPEIFTEGDATPQSDCYSCAVVLYEMLAGKNPFRGDSQAKTLHNVLHKQPELLEQLRSDVPKGLDAVLSRALSKDPTERFQTAREFAAALRTVQTTSETDARAHLANQVRVDFSREMAELLGIESLTDRDSAWRRLSLSPSSDDQSIDVIELESVEPKRSTFPSAIPTAAGKSGRLPLLQSQRPSPDSTHQRLRPPPLPTEAQSTGGFPPARPASQLAPHLVWGGVVLAVASVLAFVLRPTRATMEPGPTPVPVVKVVTAPRPAEPEAIAEPEVKPEATPQVAGPTAKAPRAARSGPNPQELTRAFRRQQSGVTACFEQHAIDLQGLPVVTLQFDLAADGTLEDARVTPRALANTQLGTCIERVAIKTRFPPQGKAVSFAIPLSASRVSSR